MIGINVNVPRERSMLTPYSDAMAYRSHLYDYNLSKRAAILTNPGWISDPYQIRKLPQKKTPEEIVNQISRIHELKKGTSFKGYCGRYVTFQLKALGIFNENRSYFGDGNTWFNGVGSQHVSKRYILKKYPGSNCLEDVVRANGNSVYNIVVCFSKGRFGHVLFIHAIINGRIYFTDSFKFNNIDERKMHILSISAFKRRYLNKGHKFMGALHFINSN